MEIANGQIGPEGSYDLDIIEGKVVGKLNYAGSQLKSNLVVELDLVAILEIVKQRIPGSIDDAIIGIVQAAIAAQQAAPKPE